MVDVIRHPSASKANDNFIHRLHEPLNAGPASSTVGKSNVNDRKRIAVRMMVVNITSVGHFLP